MNQCELAYPSNDQNVMSDGSAPRVTRVLLVDDDRSTLHLLRLMLSGARIGYVTTIATNGQDALAALQREPFDAVISDLRMPGMGGMELLVEAGRVCPQAAFLVITGVDDVEVGVQAMRLGADDYLVKPLVEAAVLASLERALHKKQLEQEVQHYRRHLEEMVKLRTGQLHAALRQIEHSYEDTLRVLGSAIDLRDHDTEGHSRRVCCYSLKLAALLGLPDAQLKNIARGSYLHDIGKLGIPDSILLKPAALTAEERKLMQQHVQIGYELVKGIAFLADAADIILSHHERFDGCGYPRGLKAEQIPMGGRIFALADALDAITSDRPYRSALSFDTARNIIGFEAGRQFDPEVAAAFLSVPRETWETMARDQGSASHPSHGRFDCCGKG